MAAGVLAHRHGVDIPAETLKSKRSMSLFISSLMDGTHSTISAQAAAATSATTAAATVAMHETGTATPAGAPSEVVDAGQAERASDMGDEAAPPFSDEESNERIPF